MGKGISIIHDSPGSVRTRFRKIYGNGDVGRVTWPQIF